jgi:cysteine desulfuration protein SufE
MDSEAGSIEDAKQSIVDEFSLFDSWVDRYEYIVELGKQLPDLPEEYRTDRYKVKGCQSQVWFRAREESDRIVFDADSDAMIVRGLIALLLRVYSDRLPGEILATPPDFFDAIELGSHLSGNRANGLAAMVNHIQSYARSFGDRNSETEIGTA